LSAPQSLARQNTLLLAGAFVLVELLTLALFVGLVMLPMARRAADDLAGLMVLSAQTWSELPPETRDAFKAELQNSHTLALRTSPPGAKFDDWHSPFFYLLELALAQRVGTPQHLIYEQHQNGDWYWARLPSGQDGLWVGLPKSRIGSHFGMALLITVACGFLLALGFAVWLARRITAPLAQLEQASALVGLGKSPVLLPEVGPRELVALSRRFNAMALQVQALLSARTTLLAGVSHDLRTPLARMRLALELLKTGHDAALIERLERDIEQMNRLIANVLDLARGLEHEVPVKTDLSEFLGELAEDFSSPACQISVQCDGGECRLPVFALHRALGNLLQNALRYAPGSPVELVCVVDELTCRFGVLDRGPGIAPSQIEAMLQPFHRLDASRSPITGGSGLGLAIVKALADANGWTLALSARPGGGLQAWLSWPRNLETLRLS
jgi:two-component system osmolarity sensor histidine kinase EnvZ